MVHYFPENGRMRYGTGSSRLRHNDRGNPSSTCARNDIDHRLTKPKHPWTNGQVERMNGRMGFQERDDAFRWSIAGS